MQKFSIRRKAQRVTRFVIVQFIALLGWVFVQLFFSISPVGRTFSFEVTLVIEAIWWMGLLLIMLLLFIIEYNRFVQAAIALEEANNHLRHRANQMLGYARDANMRMIQEIQDMQHTAIDPQGDDSSEAVARDGWQGVDNEYGQNKYRPGENVGVPEVRRQEENVSERETRTDG